MEDDDRDFDGWDCVILACFAVGILANVAILLNIDGQFDTMPLGWHVACAFAPVVAGQFVKWLRRVWTKQHFEE